MWRSTRLTCGILYISYICEASETPQLIVFADNTKLFCSGTTQNFIHMAYVKADVAENVFILNKVKFVLDTNTF